MESRFARSCGFLHRKIALGHEKTSSFLEYHRRTFCAVTPDVGHRLDDSDIANPRVHARSAFNLDQDLGPVMACSVSHSVRGVADGAKNCGGTGGSAGAKQIAKLQRNMLRAMNVA